jgi:hypothetical protein
MSDDHKKVGHSAVGPSPETIVAIWAKTVDTQMHFNEMSVKSRQFGLAFVAAALGLGIVLLSRGEEFAIAVSWFGGFTLHATVLVVIAGAFALSAVRTLDLNVYHKMLRGAVAFGEDFEERHMKPMLGLEKGMTQAISHFSRFSDAAAVPSENGSYHYAGTLKKTALDKLNRFYNFSIWTLIAVAVLLFLFTANFGQRIHPAAPQRGPGHASASNGR